MQSLHCGWNGAGKRLNFFGVKLKFLKGQVISVKTFEDDMRQERGSEGRIRVVILDKLGSVLHKSFEGWKDRIVVAVNAKPLKSEARNDPPTPEKAIW